MHKEDGSLTIFFFRFMELFLGVCVFGFASKFTFEVLTKPHIFPIVDLFDSALLYASSAALLKSGCSVFHAVKTVASSALVKKRARAECLNLDVRCLNMEG